ncbi:hypothetical protein SODALDRAFT_164231 [Sodiomyces alkalinus F11]|uniref:NTF2-domain-containing protein n=1 Tax=Sodiomyces alkalinus (strain CBS 110278 / VKM F-3762 / F11) TaxID=1314773 RepID=A0A3N2PVJ7_SODAK|nr:hypothetical protein SODALDRAFT_164231 [Sodiomyces alkalinus F11]ROT38527.1 hypothetical protein SODALDRAFT_164231 [Sodiomyces alkalinus F11]
MAANGTFANQEQLKGNSEPAPAASAETTSSGNSSNLSKDEVGWYFVEQYYTTLSKTPEKLHLFYGKRSQFVYGKEAEVASVSVGRSAIQERIKELDFQDCKVRVTNVDSMASFDNIVIQVIGETSNRAGEPQKFAQTFVLAPQPSGYFVVNDILRFISEEGEEEAAPETQEEQASIASAPTPESEVPAAAEATEKVAEEQTEVEAMAADKKPEEAAAPEAIPKPAEPTAEPTKPEAVPEPQPEAAAPPTPEAAAREVAEESVKEAEKPAEPKPTPAAPAQAAEKPAPVPAVPAKPMSWASRAAAALGAKPAVPLPKTATPPAQSKAAAPAPATAPAPTPAQQPASQTQQAAEPKESSQGGTEWQSVTDSKRQNRPQSISGSPAENPGTLGYVKYVTEKVKMEDLMAALASHGELTYFDINRTKNCAFVEFATPAGYQAAVAANPHTVNGENIVVEPRRLKAGGYTGGNYGPGRGGAANRGRGGYDGQRSGSQGGGRGGFTGQGRGRGGAPRGRVAPQATSA